MAAISLFWDTNMAAVTSCENTLLELTLDTGAALYRFNLFFLFDRWRRTRPECRGTQTKEVDLGYDLAKLGSAQQTTSIYSTSGPGKLFVVSLLVGLFSCLLNCIVPAQLLRAGCFLLGFGNFQVLSCLV